MRDKIPTPEPVPKDLICSICDQPWSLHPDDATVLDCVKLLKAKIPITLPTYPYVQWSYTDDRTYTSPWIHQVEWSGNIQ